MDASTLQLKNELSQSTSPYLRAHQHNPVAWQEWSPKAVDHARSTQKLIFLSIGYNACHWCHVMERESFSSPEVAQLLNNNFISIKLDRDVRPDLDDIYMNYVMATTGSGGWPLNVFLTPDLKPVFGGTYWPGPVTTAPRRSSGTNDETPLTFIDILEKIRDVWTNQRERCLHSASDVTDKLVAFAAEGIHSHDTEGKDTELPSDDPPEPLDLDLLDDAVENFIEKYDNTYGGFSAGPGAPKFYTPANINFLLRVGASITSPSTHTRFGFPNPVPGILGRESCIKAAAMAMQTLMVMSRSGLRDHLGWGFHRYSVTPDWNLPHFEKMMCDNAQLLGCYCDAWALGKHPEILGTIYSLVEYFTNPESPIVNPDGGWYASEDADSRQTLQTPTEQGPEERKEGAYYVWTLKELVSVLGEQDANLVGHHFGVKVDGNVAAENDVNDEFLTANVLHIESTPSVLAKEFGLPESEVVKIIKEGRTNLLHHRNTYRERPEIDTKIIASWNGLAIAALARAANTLNPFDAQRSKRCRETALKALAFIRQNMYDELTGQLDRIYNPTKSTSATKEEVSGAFLDDYAFLIHALIAVFDLTLDPSHLQWALKLQQYLNTTFLSTSSTTTKFTSTTIDTDATTTTTNPSQDSLSIGGGGGGGYFQSPKLSDQIMRLKPGTDNTLPSPNGITATNLFYLASYFPQHSTEFISRAKEILDAFAVEIIQHPFLFVTMLSAVAMEQIGVKTLIAPNDLPETEMAKLKGWGRTVVRAGTASTSTFSSTSTLTENEDTQVGGYGVSESNVKTVMICTKDGICRELRSGELEDGDGEDEDTNENIGVQGFGEAKVESNSTASI